MIPRHILRAMAPGLAIALGVILWCAALGFLCDAPQARAASCPIGLDCAHPEPPCFEDEPCWDWYRMGNGMRGWVGPWGTHHVGGACRFSRAVAHRRVFRYPHLQRMRGDHEAFRAAIRVRCVSRRAIARALPR